MWVSPMDADFDHVRILRKPTNNISGPTDPDATVVYVGAGILCAPYRNIYQPVDGITPGQYRQILDTVDLDYNTQYYYAIYAMDSGELSPSDPALVRATTPHVSAFEEIDILQTLIDYINPYMNAQIVTESLALRPSQRINVLNGPPLLESATWPMVSVHLDDDHPSEFAVGDIVGSNSPTGDGIVHRRGYMSDVSISVVGWTENPDVRKSLYRNLKGCLISVRQLLENVGLMNIVLSGRYAEDFDNYQMPYSSPYSPSRVIWSQAFEKFRQKASLPKSMRMCLRSHQPRCCKGVRHA